VAGSCEHGNEPSGSIKSGEFLDCMPTTRLPKFCLLQLIPKIRLNANLTTAYHLKTRVRQLPKRPLYET